MIIIRITVGAIKAIMIHFYHFSSNKSTQLEADQYTMIPLGEVSY